MEALSDTSTLDALLNRRVLLEQPAKGFRVAIDTVFLAATVPALMGDRILDLGCGVGGGILCVACRVPGVEGVGLENQTELADMCGRNIGRNAFASQLHVLLTDVRRVAADRVGKYDHVMMNPPYHEREKHDVSFDHNRRQANAEQSGDLPLWIEAAMLALKPSGTLSIIHRADREDEILDLLKRDFGGHEIMRLVPKTGIEAKRVVIRSRKGGVLAVRHCRPLTLHNLDGSYTREADAILRDGQALEFHLP